jgi:hypothetical protein
MLTRTESYLQYTFPTNLALFDTTKPKGILCFLIS